MYAGFDNPVFRLAVVGEHKSIELPKSKEGKLSVIEMLSDDGEHPVALTVTSYVPALVAV